MQARITLKLLCCASAGAALLLGRISYLQQQSLRGLSASAWGSAQLSDAVLLGLCGLGAVAATWYCLSTVLALVATASPRHPARSQAAWGRQFCEGLLETWGAPMVRRIAAGALVASLGTAPALAAEVPTADDFGWQPTPTISQTLSPRPADAAAAEKAPATPEPTPSPEPQAAEQPPVTDTAAAPTPAPAAPAPTPTLPSQQAGGATPAGPGQGKQHTVRPGESLWEITAAHLGLAKDSPEVAKFWPQLYETNRATIGADPELIHPGNTLSLPWAGN
ncbi:Uncharacterised protein [Actinomyces bovis]|uniref:LysM domain/BON superfamily protein n=1 Tax=Actinomyces bovis TaxID=1658 RepID=A0ABY1VMM2_9ACTO|nr:LysM domain-containing protein [Actinomyces bovis]SPT53340.1 Uncharacterised protein [Actinomyces bovis]VEG52704.1 Uncharacterised protein [Actinomyces israelii]